MHGRTGRRKAERLSRRNCRSDAGTRRRKSRSSSLRTSSRLPGTCLERRSRAIDPRRAAERHALAWTRQGPGPVRGFGRAKARPQGRCQRRRAEGQPRRSQACPQGWPAAAAPQGAERATAEPFSAGGFPQGGRPAKRGKELPTRKRRLNRTRRLSWCARIVRWTRVPKDPRPDSEDRQIQDSAQWGLAAMPAPISRGNGGRRCAEAVVTKPTCARPVRGRSFASR
jgi:hypothetical protein